MIVGLNMCMFCFDEIKFFTVKLCRALPEYHYSTVVPRSSRCECTFIIERPSIDQVSKGWFFTFLLRKSHLNTNGEQITHPENMLKPGYICKVKCCHYENLSENWL